MFLLRRLVRWDQHGKLKSILLRMWSNIHTHSTWCDGASTPFEMIKFAVESGMPSIGFSSHGPLPFPCNWCLPPGRFEAYLEALRELDRSSAIPVYTGLEIDFIPGVIGPSDFKNKLDFTIGSVHFVDGDETDRWEADNNFEVFKNGLDKYFGGNVRKAVQRYFDLIRTMLSTSTPDVLGHMDRIRVHNLSGSVFDESEPWFKKEVSDTLELAAIKNVVVEVNTRGMYKRNTPEPYPSRFALKRLAELRVPIMLASDAHHVHDLTRGFHGAVQIMKDCGIKNMVQFSRSGWNEVPLD